MTSRKNIKIFDFNGVNVAKHWNVAGEVFAISDCLVYNLMYPKIIYLKKIDIFNMTYFKRGIVVFDIHLSEFVSYIHYWHHTNQYKTEFHQID